MADESGHGKEQHDQLSTSNQSNNAYDSIDPSQTVIRPAPTPTPQPPSGPEILADGRSTGPADQPGRPMGASDSLLRVRRAWSESLRDSRRRCRRIRHSRISSTSLGDSRALREGPALISPMALDQAGRVGGRPRDIPVPTAQALSPASR